MNGKKNSTPRFGYSEKQMADAFLQLLQSSKGLPNIGTFDGVYPEANCYQGRPDFIALRRKSNHKLKPLPETTGFVGSSILSLLKSRSPRTLKYIIEHCEFSTDTIKRSLMQFLMSGHIDETKTGSYVLGVDSGQFDIGLWAFELKLENPKRAVFQAQQSRAFAECSIIVVPPSQAKNYERHYEAMKRWGIGLATFDFLTRNFSMVRRPLKSRAFSRQHQIYAIAQLYSRQNGN